MSDKISLNIDIRIDVYEARLRREIGSDLSVLEGLLESLSDPKRNKSSIVVREGITSAIVSVPSSEVVKQREINKCYKSIVGSLQDYMDNLIAVLRLKGETISIPPYTNEEGIKRIVNECLVEKLLEVSTDRKLTIPKKLSLLLDEPEHTALKESLQSYFDIRNGLEHHKGLAKAERILKYKRMGIATNTGQEITLPELVIPNEGLVVKAFDEEIKFDVGGQLIISKTQLDNLIINLLVSAIPQILNSVNKKMRVPTQSSAQK